MRYVNHRAWTERVLVVGLLLALPFAVSGYLVGLAADILVMGLLVASLDLLIGFTGLVSIGHAAFFGVGAYAVALAGTRAGLTDAVQGLLLAVVAAAVAAFVVGWFATGTKGVTFIMLTLAFAEIFVVVAGSWRSFTNGDDGITGIPVPDLFGQLLVGEWTLYYYTLVVFLIGYVILGRVTASPFGRSLQGIRANEDRMRSLGYSVRGYKLAAFTISGAVAGLAGGLHVHNVGFVSPVILGFTLSAFILVMHKIGGGGTLWGPVIGATIVLYFRDEVSSAFPRQWEALLGLLFILVVYFLPRGVAGLIQHLHQRFRSRWQPPGIGGKRTPVGQPRTAEDAVA